jgi:hypothetical protein
MSYRRSDSGGIVNRQLELDRLAGTLQFLRRRVFCGNACEIGNIRDLIDNSWLTFGY